MRNQQPAHYGSRVSRMGYVALRVTNLEHSVQHAIEIMGLREVLRKERTSYLTCNDRHHELILIEDETPSLDHIGLEVQSNADLEELRSILIREKFEILDEEPVVPGIESVLTFVGAGRFVFKIFCGMAHNQPPRYTASGERPKKFGHVTLKVANLPELEEFLTRVLGFRVSDRMGKNMSWLRCNFDHHGIGLIQHTENMIHHYAFDLQDFTAIGRVGDHLRTNDSTFIWGPGRHGPGDNLFSYFFDPDGFLVEYQADLQQIDDEANFITGEWLDEPLTVSQWGTPPPDSFFKAGRPLYQRKN